jgi:Sulfotransferase domain
MVKKLELLHFQIIYVARNPRDCIVSQFKFLSASPVMGFTGTLDDMANAFVDNTCVYAPFYDHVAGYWKYHWNQPNVFFITFEQMKKVCFRIQNMAVV